jgi:hypothetical protein
LAYADGVGMKTYSTKGTMAALALPISELTPVVVDAKEWTECVVVKSKAVVADFTNTCQIVTKTIVLRGKFSRLVTRQAKLLNSLVESDFNVSPATDLEGLAASIDELVASERELLNLANGLGSEIRVWWNASLVTLVQQVEHLELIADSLRVACDDEASTLLAVAVEQFSLQSSAAQFAMK